MKCKQKIRKPSSKGSKRRYTPSVSKHTNKQQESAQRLSKTSARLSLPNRKSNRGSRVETSMESRWLRPILTLRHSLESTNWHLRNSIQYRRGQQFRRNQSLYTSRWRCVINSSSLQKKMSGLISSENTSHNSITYPTRVKSTQAEESHMIQG